MEKTFYDLSLRTQIAAGGVVTAKMNLPTKTLESIHLFILKAGGDSVGVSIDCQGTRLYPDFGSQSLDSAFPGQALYGVIPPSGMSLDLQYNRDLQGTPYFITFTFFNNSASPVDLGGVVICSSPKKIPAPLIEESVSSLSIEVNKG